MVNNSYLLILNTDHKTNSAWKSTITRSLDCFTCFSKSAVSCIFIISESRIREVEKHLVFRTKRDEMRAIERHIDIYCIINNNMLNI